nr:MAG TPA: hypothetical protein [Caudoviricetes sp.]
MYGLLIAFTSLFLIYFKEFLLIVTILLLYIAILEVLSH